MRTILASSLLVSLLVPAVAFAAPAGKVTNGNNDGAGSLRAALASGATKIVIEPSVATIVVTETLEYTGTMPLSINGTGHTIDG